MLSTAAPAIHVTLVKHSTPRRQPRHERRSCEQPPSPVADLLPWADPYIAMLAARLEAQGREAHSAAHSAPHSARSNNSSRVSNRSEMTNQPSSRRSSFLGR